jgi:mono/diheme cytochrome c family protein
MTPAYANDHEESFYAATRQFFGAVRTGADAVNNNCLACHSADHVLNQPSLPKEAWEDVVNKMISAYKAPITSKDAAEIVEYLTRTKGAK